MRETTIAASKVRTAGTKISYGNETLPARSTSRPGPRWHKPAYLLVGASLPRAATEESEAAAPGPIYALVAGRTFTDGRFESDGDCSDVRRHCYGLAALGQDLRITQTNSNAVGGRGAATPRIAVIGCGAIAELYHLPALQANSALDGVVLVDGDRGRTSVLSQRFDVRHTSTDLREVIDGIDGAIVATPPDSHYSICLELLEHGIPVLCEKPLVPTAGEGHDLVKKAFSTDTALCVNHTRRLFQASAVVLDLIGSGRLGAIKSIQYVDGSVFNWPTASGFYFQPGARGVLFDRGIHSLDLVCWWLGAKPRLVESHTDSYGGPESMALIRLAHEDCRIDVKLSWLTRLQNYYRIEGTEATVEGGIEQWQSLKLTEASGKIEDLKLDGKEMVYNDFGVRMIANFIEVLQGLASPVVPASEVLNALELIEESYERAQRMKLPWLFGGALRYE